MIKLYILALVSEYLVGYLYCVYHGIIKRICVYDMREILSCSMYHVVCLSWYS